MRRARTPGDWTLDLLIGEHIGDFVLSFFIVVIRSLSCVVYLWTWQHRCKAECRVIEQVHTIYCTPLRVQPTRAQGSSENIVCN